MRTLRLLADQSPTANDIALLILRLAVAAVFVAHGWSDVFDAGVATNVQNYADAGIPLASLSAPFAAYVQLIGGVLCGLGLLTRPTSLGFALVMAGALIFVHPGEPLVLAPDGSGSGYAFIMGAASLALLLIGPGRLSLDQLLRTARRTHAGA